MRECDRFLGPAELAGDDLDIGAGEHRRVARVAEEIRLAGDAGRFFAASPRISPFRERDPARARPTTMRTASAVYAAGIRTSCRRPTKRNLTWSPSIERTAWRITSRTSSGEYRFIASSFSENSYPAATRSWKSRRLSSSNASFFSRRNANERNDRRPRRTRRERERWRHAGERHARDRPRDRPESAIHKHGEEKHPRGERDEREKPHDGAERDRLEEDPLQLAAELAADIRRVRLDPSSRGPPVREERSA